jgi:hypothetical protein
MVSLKEYPNLINTIFLTLYQTGIYIGIEHSKISYSENNLTLTDYIN